MLVDRNNSSNFADGFRGVQESLVQNGTVMDIDVYNVMDKMLQKVECNSRQRSYSCFLSFVTLSVSLYYVI